MISINHRLPAFLRDLLAEVQAAATALAAAVYLVGGTLRDVLLRRPVIDVDLAVDGDVIALALELCQRHGAHARTHRAFGTATLQLREFRVDLARLRSETYSRPGALPKVSPGSLGDDLARRDFTINAIAWPLGGGAIVDPFGGQRDLRRRLIRVLHQGSFVDDATRILRAVRYERRLGFTLEAETERLIRRDCAYLDTISGDRLRHELDLIFAEPEPETVLRRADELGVLSRLSPTLHLDEATFDHLAAARKLHASPLVYLCLLAYTLTESEVLGRSGMAEHLNLGRQAHRALADTFALQRRLPELEAPDLRPSRICGLLESFVSAAIDAVLLVEPPTASRRALERLRWYRERGATRLLLSGTDLLRLGARQGPAIGQILRALRDAQLDGQVRNRRQATALVQELMAQPAPQMH